MRRPGTWIGALAVLAVACGGAGTSTPSPAPSPSETAAAGVPGCGDQAVTDPADLSPDRPVARCEPGAPPPRPLAERQTVRFASAFRAEFMAPILLADHFGEFEKENLEFEFVELGFSDAAPQMATGDIDLAIGGAEAAFYNAVASGIDIRWILGVNIAPHADDLDVPQVGLWVRRDVFSDPEDPDLSELAGRKVASAVGPGSAINYALARALEPHGVRITDLVFERIPSADMVQALRNGAVDGAILLDPYWVEIADDPDFLLVATLPPGENIAGVFASDALLEQRRDVALAFVRAYIRTINTYLSGDYHQDDEIVDAISQVTGIPADVIRLTPSIVFDWEIRSGTTDRIQEVLRELDVLDYEGILPEDRLVDRSLYLEAVGAA